MSLTAVPPIELREGERIVWWERHRPRLDRFLRRGSTVGMLIPLLVLFMQLFEDGVPDFLRPTFGVALHSFAILVLLTFLIGFYLRACATELTVTDQRVRVAQPGDIRWTPLSSLRSIQVLPTGVVFDGEGVTHEKVHLAWHLSLFATPVDYPESNLLVFPLRAPERLLDDLRTEGLLADAVAVSIERAVAARPVKAWLRFVGGIALVFLGLALSFALRDHVGTVLSLIPFLLALAAGVPLFIRGAIGLRDRYLFADDGVSPADRSLLERSPPPDDP